MAKKIKKYVYLVESTSSKGKSSISARNVMAYSSEKKACQSVRGAVEYECFNGFSVVWDKSHKMIAWITKAELA